MIKLNEREIISLFVARLNNNNNKTVTGFGKDDVAVLPLKKAQKNKYVKLIFKSDMLVESTDIPAGMKPWQVARKSIVSCISDLSAKGIKPYYLSLISIGIPAKYSKTEIIDLIKGFQIACTEFGVKIVGGDTNESNELVIDCSMIGFYSDGANNNIPKRNGARPGDLIVVSGEFGYSSSGLKILMSRAKAKGKFKRNAILSVVKPKPQQKFGISLARYFSSSMDSSDGLAKSLYELAEESKVNFFVNNIPSAKGIKQFAEDNQLDVKELIFYGGEEYQIVATVPLTNAKKAKSIACKEKLKLYVIGEVKKGEGKVFARERNNGEKYLLLDNRGYVHLVK